MMSGLALADQTTTWPQRPVTIVVPFPPGGATDQLGRLVAERFTASFKQPAIVDNKPGAGGMIGSQFAAKAPADGYTFLVGSVANVLNHYFYRKIAFDFNKDLVPVAQLIQSPNYLGIAPNPNYKTLNEMIAYAKKHPKELSCANTGVGASPYLSCELLKKLADIDIVNVPYKGGMPAIQDTMAGQTSMVFSNELLPFIADKRLIGIGVTSPERSPFTPDIPALRETLPGFDITSWYGLFAPAGTPPAIVQKAAAEVNAMLKEESVRKRLALLSATPVIRTQPEFAAYVSSEFTRWGEILKPMNIKLD
jgi:tripartite-type tricarboxylate transporter receptor subunit TctC